MWLGEQITERGIGNGMSLLIFFSIIESFPAAIGPDLGSHSRWARSAPFALVALSGGPHRRHAPAWSP